MAVVRSVLMILFGLFVATTARSLLVHVLGVLKQVFTSIILSGNFESEEAIARLVTVPTDLAQVGADVLMNFVLALPFIVGSLIVKYWIYLLFP